MWMRSLSQWFAIALIVASVSAAAAQVLTDTEVDAAIKAGQENKFQSMVATCTARPGSKLVFANREREMKVAVFGPAAQIAIRAFEAKRKYLGYAASDVTPDLREPIISVAIDPGRRERNARVLPPKIEHVVLKSKSNPGQAIQPTSLAIDSVRFANLFGFTADVSKALATFPEAAVASLPGNEILVAIVTTEGEQGCGVRRRGPAGRSF